MSLRQYLNRLEANGTILQVKKPVSKTYEVAGILKKAEPSPVLFGQIKESGFRVLGNLCCSKEVFADYLGIPVRAIIPTLTRAIEERSRCSVVEDPPCQEVVISDPDLDSLPILRHCQEDGGNYISSGVFVARHPELGQNIDFHRCMQISKTEMAVRVVPGRDFDRFLNELGQVDVAVCVGVSPHVLIAAATSVATGINELEIANVLQPTQVARGKTVDVLIPAEAEFVLEGTVFRDRRHSEGPFVDLTGTYDQIRQEPVFEVKCITHRQNAIWHALLPGALEHKLLMGMPREPTIFREVNKVVECLDVNINPGGCSWLHAIIQIRKHRTDDGEKAIQAAFEGHRSCKHVFVVDEDVDIYNPLEVEWAMATRFQADSEMVVRPGERGSSLDPSANPKTNQTTKVGFDLTMPIGADPRAFRKAAFPEVDLTKYLEGK